MALIHCHFCSQILEQMSSLSAILPVPGPEAVALFRGPFLGRPAIFPLSYYPLNCKELFP